MTDVEQVVPSLLALALFAKAVHWNARGALYRDAHEHAGVVFDLAVRHVDRLAERFTDEGPVDVGPAVIAERGVLTEPPKGEQEARAALGLLAEAVGGVVALLERVEVDRQTDTLLADAALDLRDVGRKIRFTLDDRGA